MGNVHMEATQINYRGGATKMNVEDAIKSAIELTPEQKTNINKIPTIEAAVATKTDQAVIAPEFDAESGIYAIGDLVMHEGKLYEFTSAHETAGEWNSSEVSEKTVADEVDSLMSGLTNVISNVVFEPEQSPGTDPFNTNGTGYVMKIKFQGTLLGYLVIRPKGYVTDQGAHNAFELYNTEWSPMWYVEYHVTN